MIAHGPADKRMNLTWGRACASPMIFGRTGANLAKGHGGTIEIRAITAVSKVKAYQIPHYKLPSGFFAAPLRGGLATCYVLSQLA